MSIQFSGRVTDSNEGNRWEIQKEIRDQLLEWETASALDNRD